MSFYPKIIRPLLFKVAPEAAHEFGIEALRIGLNSKVAQDFTAKRFAVESFGEIERFGLRFNNPLGVAAGFDKNGVVVNQLAALGFGFVEVGTVTFNPQKGNEKPRLFRLPEDKALINRLGFNNQGTLKVVERLKKIQPNCVLGVNIGKNKDVPNEAAIENYLASFDSAFEVADYIAVNVSSPNTPNLRELQKAENLEDLLSELQKRNKVLSSAFRRLSPEDLTPEGGTPNLKPLLVKIAPDLNESEIEAIVDIACRFNLAGIIATNTTIKRENLKTKIDEIGGLSGKPLREKSNEIVSKIYRFTKGKMPVIGVGGIFDAADAFEKIAAGACLIQAYTGFVYQGISFAREINCGLQKILKEHGFSNLDEAIGSENKL
ncbi:MAG: quinone-dependent dihydroorotate dehydrogenase [Pyrinomonadaceae bacterium]|nr:quinone-dependent dihydroorotate dehydrogenase [Pyrinomonadaceae bacterium]